MYVIIQILTYTHIKSNRLGTCINCSWMILDVINKVNFTVQKCIFLSCVQGKIKFVFFSFTTMRNQILHVRGRKKNTFAPGNPVRPGKPLGP